MASDEWKSKKGKSQGKGVSAAWVEEDENRIMKIGGTHQGSPRGPHCRISKPL